MKKKIHKLVVENIVSGYGDMDILKGVSINISQEEIVVIIGPNGAGKSTLMKSIFGLIPIKEGNIYFDEEEITNMDTQSIVRKGISYVPQVKNIFPNLTVQENLEMGAYLRKDDFSETLSEVFKLYPDLVEKRNQVAGQLSGGQQQMVAIGRALMIHPEFILLDEPTAGLSPKMYNETFESIQKIKTLGVGVIMVEQNAKKALQISDRGCVLVSGENKLTASGQSLLMNENITKLFLGGNE